MKLTLAILLLVAASSAIAQEAEQLWMPEGYRFLTLEERQALPPAELQAIGIRNQEILRAAVKAMSREERQQVAVRLESYGKRPEATQVEKQYVTMTEMLLMATVMDEQNQKMKQVAQDRREALLKEQEETSKGFPSDQKSVEKEAWDVESAMAARGDYRLLYLRILKPLRARPWNHEVRVAFRRIVRGMQYELVDPALAFVEKRQKESPQEGAWDSLRAFLLLSFKGDVAEARRLFAIAVEKNANDVESRIFPLLMAQIDGNAADVARYEPRARQAWPKPEDLERVLFDQIDVLPESLKAKAKETVAAKYRARHPADWGARSRNLMERFEAKDNAGVEKEANALLALPTSALPDEDRLSFSLLRIRARAAAAAAPKPRQKSRTSSSGPRGVHPPQFDGDVAPRAHTEAEVRRMRTTLKQAEEQRVRVDRWRKGDAADMPGEISGLAADERKTALDGLLVEMDRSIAAMHGLVDGRDDPSAALAWSRSDLETWEKAHQVTPTGNYDISGDAESLSMIARSETARCWLSRSDAVAAARLVTPCAGAGRNWHSNCVSPLEDAGILLAQTNHVKEAIAIYQQLRPAGSAVDLLFGAIEKASPGSVAPPKPDRPRPLGPG